MALPSFLSGAVDSWAAFYEAHRVVSVTIRFLHLLGIVVGGGTALAIDRQVLRVRRLGATERAKSLAALASAHRVVVPALAVVVLTGALMTATDRDTFLLSRLYWAKMGLVALLLVNGAGLVAAEALALRTQGAAGWTRLGIISAASILLWLLILYFGVWLTVAA